MKKNIATLFGLFLAIIVNAQSNEKTIVSTIKQVRVFLSKAEVSNIAQTSVGVGTTTLVFEELPARLEQASLQVNAKGAVTIMAVKHRINYLKSQAKAEKIKKFEADLEELQDELNRLQMQKKIFQEEEAMILANKQVGGENSGVSAQKLKEVADFYRLRLGEINQKVLELNKQIKKTQEKEQQTRKQIQEENAQANKPSSEVLVTIKSETPGNVSFEISYIVPDAGWQPIYDIRSKDAKSPAQLMYRANVFQNTGLDWNNVKISLSSGNPSVGGNKPELAIWYVNQFVLESSYRYENKRTFAARKQREVTTMAYGAAADRGGVEDLPNKEAETIADFTNVQENTLATEFEIALPYSIPSDGKPQLVDVQKFDVNTIYTYSAAPKLDKDAFLTARLIEWEKFNLISGKANVYFEGAFVGETYLNANNTKDTLVISLGRDKKIVIEREQIKDLTTKKKLSSHIKEDFGYEIRIRNTKKERIVLYLEDQIPISKNSKIEVELLEATGAKADSITGKLIWKLEVNPSETKKIRLRYSIRYPKDMQIQY
jgi:uncharacterized protein (TIGR02231 family)